MSLSLPRWEGHIERIYRAAVDPALWPGFLESLSRDLGAETLHLLFRLPQEGDGGVVVSHGMDASFADAYRTHFFRVNPWRPFGPEVREGAIVLGERLLPEQDLVRSEFYNDWMRPQRLMSSFAAILSDAGPGEPASELVGYRNSSSGSFGDEVLALIEQLLPHLQQALMIHGRLQKAEVSVSAAEAALDRVLGGVIVLDGDGTPLVSNRTAEEILSRGDGIRLGPNGPQAASHKETQALQRAVAEAAGNGAAGNGQRAGAHLRLSRPSGRSPLEADVTPICLEGSRLECSQAAAAIFIADPEAHSPSPEQRIRRLYGLTPTEARIASRLAEGTRLSEIGEALGVSIHTVRGHLKQIFAKTHTHRQADLVRLLVGGRASLRLD